MKEEIHMNVYQCKKCGFEFMARSNETFAERRDTSVRCTQCAGPCKVLFSEPVST